ncbi:MAG: YdbL family protein [Gammaproteobacteria bacterium]|nr:YdbL family protein [Gammaproteobacteria bacterium]MDH3559521.1 YdbL family protein [Gammaproteobacteria bacterium]
MKTLRIPMTMLLILFAAACVTINVYFPAEAAEKAADRIIKDVYGEQPAPSQGPAAEPQSRLQPESVPARYRYSLLDWLVSPANAAADLSVNTPAISQLKADMEQRHRQLAPHYASGAVGMTHNGEIDIRDQTLIPLKDRNTVKQLVAKENRDRGALYTEIARANGHPEWESEIRQTFARRWVDNAPGGWWYSSASGSWKQK